MSKKNEYQPTRGDGGELSNTQEVLYNDEFKQADIAGGYRKPAVKQNNGEDPEKQQ